MGRWYHLAKTLAPDMEAIIMEEIRELPDVERADFSADKKYLLVETAGDKYPAVMTRILNICCRVGNGCELSFAGFEEQLKGVVEVAR